MCPDTGLTWVKTAPTPNTTHCPAYTNCPFLPLEQHIPTSCLSCCRLQSRQECISCHLPGPGVACIPEGCCPAPTPRGPSMLPTVPRVSLDGPGYSIGLVSNVQEPNRSRRALARSESGGGQLVCTCYWDGVCGGGKTSEFNEMWVCPPMYPWKRTRFRGPRDNTGALVLNKSHFKVTNPPPPPPLSPTFII